MLPIYVLIADSSHARLFSMEGKNQPLAEKNGWINTSGRAHERELASDSPGRSFDSGGQGRHSMEARQTPKQHEVETFAKYLGDQLNQYRKNNEFQELVLIAAPEFLGLLRSHLDEATKGYLSHQLDKNITQLNSDSLQDKVRELLETPA